MEYINRRKMKNRCCKNCVHWKEDPSTENPSVGICNWNGDGWEPTREWLRCREFNWNPNLNYEPTVEELVNATFTRHVVSGTPKRRAGGEDDSRS